MSIKHQIEINHLKERVERIEQTLKEMQRKKPGPKPGGKKKVEDSSEVVDHNNLSDTTESKASVEGAEHG